MKSLFLFAIVSLGLMAHALSAPLRVVVSSDEKAFADALSQDLTARGAKVSSAASWQPSDLSDADVFVMQASQAKTLSPAQCAAMEAFARRGGGLVLLKNAIASGDAAFMKSLAGGGWTEQSRKFENRMMLYTLTDGHPIVHNASPFDIDDDASYDLETDPAIVVLGSAFTPKVTAKKIDPRSPLRLDHANIYDLQPQMWTYEGADKHRAFVLLQGNAQTLQHKSIQVFIQRAIAWTANREKVDELCRKEDLATMRYPEGGPRLAADTVKQFEMHPGFTATAIASEPLINKPIAMQWDGAGRLWVAETPEYPNGRRPLVTEAWKETGALVPGNYDRPAQDRISVLEDTDGDGVMDKKNVFHQGLELVTGFCLYGDGVIAVGQPNIVFLHDTDGDGKADKEQPLFTGFSPGDTHFVANHFIVAPDGWIYANTGSGPDAKSVTHPEVKARLSAGIFRFKPDGSAIEQVSSKGGNGFGNEVTSDGELFFGQATSGSPVQHVVLPEWILGKGKVGSTGSAQSVINGRKVIRPDMPDRAALMQIDVVGGYSAACASMIYEGGSWPAEWNNGIFCTEPILDIIHHEKLVPAGSTFTGEMVPPDKEWLRSKDYWFFPNDVATGPDGAMYVLDLYCPVVAHSDSRGPQHSKTGASIRPDRDHYFGRIYRIQHDQAQKIAVPDLSKANAVALVKAFENPNKTTRFTAHRLLMDRKDAATAGSALLAMARDSKSVQARILALWALQRLGKMEVATLQTALQSTDASIRKAALLMVETQGAHASVNTTALLHDADVRVRLTALRALASAPMSTETAAVLLEILPGLEDDYSKSAAVAAASSNAGPVLEAALALKGAPSNTLLDLAVSLANILIDKQDSAGLAKVIVAASKASSEAAPLVRAVLESASNKIPAAPADTVAAMAALKSLLAASDQALSASALPFAVLWDKDGALKSLTTSRIQDLLGLMVDVQQADATRASAVHGLIHARSADPRIVTGVIDLLKTKLSDALLLDVISALAITGDPVLGKPMVSVLPNLSPLGQTAAFDALTTRTEWANAVLDALESKELPATLLGPARLSKLRLHPDPVIAKRSLKVIDAIGGGTSSQKNDIIAQLLTAIEGKPGNAANGKLVYTAACAVCHKLNGEGKEVGPPLDGIGVHGANELLTHIIDPSRVVDNEHRTISIALRNGTFAMGIVGRENERTVTLRLPGGVEQDIKVADIKSRQDTGLSLMPEGFEALGADTLRDILTHLSGGTTKFRALNLGRVFTTDTLGGLYQSREAKNDTVQPMKYGVVTVEGVGFSLADPSTTPTGGNVIVLKGGGPETFAKTMPQSVDIPVGYAVGNLHFLSGVAGWGGRPDTNRPAMKLIITHADGKTQIEEMNTGDKFIDYVREDDLPGSKNVEGIMKRGHIRYFSIPVEQRSVVTKITLESYDNGITPTTLAITTDTEAPLPRKKYSVTAVEAPKL